ncbi:MAG: hypothetical protein EOP04_29285 [Proteobacteria bacterium]|nr:MAG: hypothetical protein EOP04_29285 [Pseudomonadota bacterium]
MDSFTKMLFLDMTKYQFSKMLGSQYFDTYASLTDEKKVRLAPLTKEIHDIFVGRHQIEWKEGPSTNTIWDYNELVAKVSPELLEFAEAYELDLAEEPLTKEMRAMLNKVLGSEATERLFGED